MLGKEIQKIGVYDCVEFCAQEKMKSGVKVTSVVFILH